jgi:hypothetical protein
VKKKKQNGKTAAAAAAALWVLVDALQRERENLDAWQCNVASLHATSFLFPFCFCFCSFLSFIICKNLAFGGGGGGGGVSSLN